MTTQEKQSNPLCESDTAMESANGSQAEVLNTDSFEEVIEEHNDLVVRAFSSNVSLSKGDERTVVAKISTTAVDREGDVILPSGLQLQDYKANPVVLINHDAGRLPIGRALGIRRTSDSVIAKVQFAKRPDEHPITAEWVPDTIYSLFKQKVLRAFSVGFIPMDMRGATDKDRKRYGDEAKRIITQWRLMEFSVVPIPANQEALAVEIAKSSKWLADAWHVDVETKKPRLVVDGPLRFSLRDPSGSTS